MDGFVWKLLLPRLSFFRAMRARAKDRRLAAAAAADGPDKPLEA